jgi:hypothetical protein
VIKATEARLILDRVWKGHPTGYKGEVASKHDWVGLEISPVSSDTTVTVYTPGDRWVTLEVPGRFSHNHFEEDMTEADLESWVRLYITAGLAFLEGQYSIQQSRVLRVPFIVIQTPTSKLRLDLSIGRTIRAALRREHD